MTENELYHHGIAGQKWGVRRYQTEDGSLTAAGRERYSQKVINGIRTTVTKARNSRLTNTVQVTQQKPHGGSLQKGMSSARTSTAANMMYQDILKDASNPKSMVRVENFKNLDSDDFRVAAAEILGPEVDNLSEEELAEMQKKFNSLIADEESEEGSGKTIDELADRVIRGEFGNGDQRRMRLGSNYDEVQRRVNEKLRHYNYDPNELYHHGILGMKWGVRRYQNEDGSYTEAGKKRYRLKDRARDAANNFYSSHRDAIATVGKVAAFAAVAGVSAYAISQNKEAVANFLKSAGSATVKTLSESTKRVGNAMVDAALYSIGGIAIAKVAQSLPTDDSLDERTRNTNTVVRDTVTAGIREATQNKTNGSSNSNNSTGKTVGKEISDRLGPPSNKGIDRQSSAYQNLFKDKNGNQRDSDTRSVIKSLAANGYDINQLQEYVNGVDNGTIKHSAIELGYFAINDLLGYELW